MVPPASVIGLPGDKNQVWLYDEKTKTVAPRPVKVGKLSPQGIEILKGLKPGDILIIRGANRLTEGMKVKLLDSKATS